MQISATRHSSRISMVFTASLLSSSTGSGMFAVATCPGGVSGGSTCNRLGKAAVPVTNSATVAASALATAMLPNVVARGASTTLPVRDGERRSSIDTTPLMPAEPEASKRGDDPTRDRPFPAQRRRHLRKLPRVHDPVASTRGHAQSTCDGADLYGRAMSKLRGYRFFRKVSKQLASARQTPS